MKPTLFVWFTGLSGSGKSTVCEGVAVLKKQNGTSVEILDGDSIRDRAAKKIGFSREEIRENNLAIARLCAERIGSVDLVLVPVIAPIESVRTEIRDQLGHHFKLVFCAADLESVSGRDVKGLYRKARVGEIQDMIGYNGVPYDIPVEPDLVLNTGGNGLSENDAIEISRRFIEREMQRLQKGYS